MNEYKDNYCPAGDDCPVHYRVNGRLPYQIGGPVAVVSYVGDYVVYTTDNPDMLTELFEQLSGLRTNLPNAFETNAYRVGPEGTLADVIALPGDEFERTVAFRQAFCPVEKRDDLDDEQFTAYAQEKLYDGHDMVVDMARDGLLTS